uniref:Replication initiation protein n=1 Tax=Streptomyces sp. NBC_00148 TaxID=2903626 RepID=A0AAU1M5Q6_9ACTN
MLVVAPGVVSLGWPDVARRERTAERAQEAARKAVSDLARYLAEYVGDPAETEPTRTVQVWSAKSRARMTRTLAELDYEPLLRMGLRLPMTTLTYPGDWLVVAPTGKAVKKHMTVFYRRFGRAWGFEWLGIWKLEFQRRGAPHIHLWGPQPKGLAGDLRQVQHAADLLAWEASGRKGRKPYSRSGVGDGLPYREWLSVVWADVVAHPDPEQRRRHQLAGTGVDLREGERMTDPKRLAVYFSKHGSYGAKEYQNEVPEPWQAPGCGPGRFWGYRGLERAAAGVEMTPADAVFVARTLRRLARSQGVTRRVTVQRVNRRTGVIRYRTVRRPVVRLGNGAGFLCVNDGPALAAGLARALERQGQDADAERRAAAAAEAKLARLRLAATARQKSRT